MKELDEERRHSITLDNGTEFARCHRLEKHLGIALYFADPGCPYQRGTNENTNGLIDTVASLLGRFHPAHGHGAVCEVVLNRPVA